MDRSFDIEYWQRQGDAAIYRAAWELVEMYHRARARTRMNSDFRDLLRIFNAGKVRYLVVGEYAVMKCTEPRYTKDLDLWIDATPRTPRRCSKGSRNSGTAGEPH